MNIMAEMSSRRSSCNDSISKIRRKPLRNIYLRFTTTAGNLTEQTIRSIMIDRKITRGSRSDWGQCVDGAFLESVANVSTAGTRRDEVLSGLYRKLPRPTNYAVSAKTTMNGYNISCGCFGPDHESVTSWQTLLLVYTLFLLSAEAGLVRSSE